MWYSLAMDIAKNMLGRRAGRLTVISRAPPVIYAGRVYAAWVCLCRCGKQVTAIGSKLRNGHTKSCGCYKIDRLISRSVTHGHSRKNRSPEYKIWCSIKQRCYNPQNPHYKNYGGRGIKMSDSWYHSYEKFFSDIGKRPKGHSIERVDNNGDYSKENCKWIPFSDQGCNKRNTILVPIHGGKMVSLRRYAEINKLNYLMLYRRFRLWGWGLEAATQALRGS